MIAEWSSSIEEVAEARLIIPKALRNAPRSLRIAPQNFGSMQKSSGNASQCSGNDETAGGNVIGKDVTAIPSFRHGLPESRLHGCLQIQPPLDREVCFTNF